MTDTGLPTLNVELLEAVIGRIRAEPANWDQSTYACGTTRCFAGHAVELVGATPLVENMEDLACECVTPEGEIVRIAAHARHALGLTAAEACELFEVLRSRSNHTTDVDVLHGRVKDLIDSRSKGKEWIG